MKQVNYLLLTLIFAFFINCEKPRSEDKLSDEDFIEYINDKTPAKSVKRIDSLAKTNNYSIHKTGLLYYEKGRILGKLEKDAEAVGSLTQALVSFEKEGDKIFIAKTNMLLGDSEAFLSNNVTALKHTTKALNIFKEIEDKKGEAKSA